MNELKMPEPLNEEKAKEITRDLVEHFKTALMDERPVGRGSIIGEVLSKYLDPHRSVTPHDSYYLDDAYENAIIELLKEGIAVNCFFKFPENKPGLVMQEDYRVLDMTRVEDYNGMGGWTLSMCRLPDEEDMKRNNGWFMGSYEDPEHEKEVICTPLEFKDEKWYNKDGEEIKEVFEWMPYPKPRFRLK